MRERRLAAELSLRTMGSLVGKSHCFLSQLESGKRRWTQALLDKYHRVIKEQDK
jgi:transcriptional regulator with XRE-family HTH domain